MAAKQTYTVLSPLELDGSHHGIGASVEIDDKTAATLLQLGVVAKGEPDAEGEQSAKRGKK